MISVWLLTLYFFSAEYFCAENHTPFALVTKESCQLVITVPRRKYLVFYGKSSIHLINWMFPFKKAAIYLIVSQVNLVIILKII